MPRAPAIRRGLPREGPAAEESVMAKVCVTPGCGRPLRYDPELCPRCCLAYMDATLNAPLHMIAYPPLQKNEEV